MGPSPRGDLMAPLREAQTVLESRGGEVPLIGVILGTGLGGSSKETNNS